MNIEQKIAAVAVETVRAAADKNYSGDYRHACESLPARLLQSGLLPVLAWLGASNQSWDRQLGKDMRAHLDGLGIGPEMLSKAGSAEYQVYFEITLKAAVWQKRIAKALIPKNEADA